MVSRLAAGVIVVALAAGAAALWYYFVPARNATDQVWQDVAVDDDWLDHLYSQNPKVAESAAEQLSDLGEKALPEIREVLQDPGEPPARKKAALKASGMLGPIAAPLIRDIAEHLPDPALTSEAAVALSYVGREAFPPLREALDSDDPVVRREALRSIGKLRERAPLDPRVVVPLLVERLDDPDPGVRTVAATYLGIVGHDADRSVPALLKALADDDAEVRSAAATALGSFPDAAARTIPALRRAMGDADENVAREAGTSVVKLQSSRPPK